MKKLLPAFLCLTIFFAACEKNDDKEDASGQTLATGLYKGTFSRTGMDTVNVSFSVVEGKFEGESERPYYPAICGGNVIRTNSGISFSDSCTWQANFDWTLILDGEYQLSENGTKVRIWKMNGAITDEYLLTRQVR